MRHQSAALVLAAILCAVRAQAASGASSTPRLPTGAADLATFSAAEKKAALDYEWQQFQMALRAGTTQLHVASSGGTNGLSGVASITTASVTYSYFVSGYHGAQQYAGGSWQLGPDRYCSASASP